MPVAPSNAETVFLQIEKMASAAERAEFIRKYVDDRQHETDWLDFKAGQGVKNLKDGDTDKWIKFTLGKYQSAFGNSGGGLLIWGVGTDVDPTLKKDCAIKLSRVPLPGELLTRIDQLHNSLVSPPVPGVQVIDIVDPDANEGGSGFVVLYVPDSPHKPHRSEFDDHYYLRSGSHCHHPTPTVLRHLFYPRVTAVLGISKTVSLLPAKKPTLLVRFRILNKGNGTAREPAVIFQKTSGEPRDQEMQHVRIPPQTASQAALWRTETVVNEKGYIQTLYTSAGSIHPGLSLELLDVEIDLTVKKAIDIYFTTYAFDLAGSSNKFKINPHREQPEQICSLEL